jgi:ubiquinone/menaquinone biosynthesis C-methylase UbiE
MNNWLNSLKGDKLKIVNIGFGTGNLEREYFQSQSQAKGNWYGIDISPAAVKMVQKEFPNGKFEVGNILEMKFPNNHFDYAIALEVLQLIVPRNTFQALGEVKRVVKPGGYFIVSVPVNEDLEGMIARGENYHAHVREYTPKLIEAELQIAGFTIKDDGRLYGYSKLGRYVKFEDVLAKDAVFKKYKPNNVLIFAQKPVS